MITEEYVDFDTAKLLKEAGFDIEYGIISVYDDGSELIQPTQSLAARWLREAHAIHILVTPLLDGWMVDLFDLNKYQYILCNKDTMADTYEEALEDGLQEALQVIIKRKEARND